VPPSEIAGQIVVLKTSQSNVWLIPLRKEAERFMPEEQICGWFACLQFHLLVCNGFLGVANWRLSIASDVHQFPRDERQSTNSKSPRTTTGTPWFEYLTIKHAAGY